MKKILFFSSCVFILFSSSVQARTVTFEEQYTYDASEADSKLTCRAISLLQVKQLLLERLGTYLETETEVVNFQLTKDEVTVLTAGIVKTQIISEEWDGKTYLLTARIEADPEVVAQSVKELRMNRDAGTAISKLEDVNTRSLEKIEELKNEMTRVQENIVSINQDYRSASKIIDAYDSGEDGLRLMREGHYSDAINAFNKAIELKPKYSFYYHRGRSYIKLKKCGSAVKDFDTVISLNPEVKDAYFFKGKCLLKMGKRKEGLSSIKKASNLGSGNAKRWLKLKGK
jgi:tetratricopeptide (TPR) repeat protein